jgi:putative heme-binding domain-containing protein
MARSGLKAMPKEWAAAMVKAIEKNHNLVADVLDVFRALPATEAEYGDLVKASGEAFRRNVRTPDMAWLQVHAAAPPGVLGLESRGFDLARLGLEQRAWADVVPTLRPLAIDVFARHKLTSKQLVELAAVLKAASPLELPKLLGVFEKSKDEVVGLALVKALREKELRAAVRAEMVKPILDKYPQAVKDEAEKLYAELAEARKDEKAKLDKLLAELKPGEVRRGQLVFNNAKAQCIACHKMGYVGGTVGPDLTRIGGIRTERDLLEAIVFPSASFVRSYESVRVVTTDERTFNGILKKDAPDEIIIVVAADKEERVARADVASITPSSVSLMPSGLDQQLTPQDLADLVAFLRASK